MDPKLKIDLMTILFIIILSYVFLYSTGGHNYQMTFIAFGLCILVAHKISYKLINSQENYTDMTTAINQFIDDTRNQVSSQNTTSDTSNSKLEEYISAINSLKTQLSDLNNQINTANSADIIRPVSDVYDNRMNIETQQSLQSYQIDYLKKQIEKTKELVNANKIQSDMSKYKPIKVYSSCAISNADGSLSALNQPTLANGFGSGTGLSQFDSIGPVNPSNSQLLSTLSQTPSAVTSMGTSMGTSATSTNQNNFLAQILSGLAGIGTVKVVQ
jgi:hypothetical protein